MKLVSFCSTMAVAALAGIASAQVVNLGNLNATSTGQNLRVVVPGSGPYNSVIVSANWVVGVGNAWSNEARWALFNGATPLVSNSNAGAGSANNSNPATVSWTRNFGPVNSGTPLNFYYGQVFAGFANWNNVTLTFGTFSAPAALNIGSINAGSSLTIATGGVLTGGNNTVLGLFDSTGNVLNTNNDDGPGNFSRLLSTLGPGTYYAAVADYNSAVAGATGGAGYGFVFVGGTDVGTTTLSVTNGTTTLASTGEALAVGGVNWYSFTVVPTPGAAALLGLGGLATTRRRR